MSTDQQSLVATTARYGLPVVVGIFYVTASLGFDYTASNTFQLLNASQHGVSPGVGFPSPLWQFLLGVADWFHLNILLASKVLSLLFSCVAVLLMYLVANEILHDRLLALFISLVTGMQGWLLQIAPSGSPLSLAVTLILATLFFMLRNEYLVAPFMLGLSSLVAWQTVFLLFPLTADIWINSVHKRRAMKLVAGATLIFMSALLPWGLYVWKSGANVLPVLLQFAELPPDSFASSAIRILLVVIALIALGASWRLSKDRMDVLRVHSGTLTFMGFLLLLRMIYHVEVHFMVIPLLITYGLLGLEVIARQYGNERTLYSTALAFTGLLVVHFQLDYSRVDNPAMESAIDRARELRSIAEWIGANATVRNTVCGEQSSVLEYYTGRPVQPFDPSNHACGDIVVTSLKDLAGYDAVSISSEPTVAAGVLDRHYVVWRRK